MVCDDEYSHDELVNGKKKMNILQLTPGENEGEVVGWRRGARQGSRHCGFESSLATSPVRCRGLLHTTAT